MPPFPSSFPPKRESITTFDFVDIANGLGYEKFWLVGSEDSAGIKHVLTNLILGADNNATFSETTSSLAINFDTSTFNLPRTVKGIALAQMQLKLQSGSNSTNAYSIKMQVVHADNSTTDISSQIDSNATVGLFSTPSTFLMEIPLTQTTIKKGEKIRTIVTITESASSTLILDHDGDESRIFIPFRIDTT